MYVWPLFLGDLVPRGAFGTHVAVLLRRLRRVLQIYKAAPLFIACSATMRNSAPFFTQLVGLDEAEVCVVSDDASGRGARTQDPGPSVSFHIPWSNLHMECGVRLALREDPVT